MKVEEVKMRLELAPFKTPIDRPPSDPKVAFSISSFLPIFHFFFFFLVLYLILLLSSSTQSKQGNLFNSMSTARSSLQAETLHQNESSEKSSAVKDKDPSKQVGDHDLTTENQLVTDSNGNNPKPETDVYAVDDEKYIAGMEKFNKLTWKQLTIVLIVEAIALGSLSQPSVFATLGLVPALILNIGIGMIAIQTSSLVGATFCKYPSTCDYAEAGRLLAGKWGYYIGVVMFTLQLSLVTAGHVLTGTIAFNNLSNHAICSVAFGVVAAVILYIVALPPSFAEMAILGYIDFVSIIAAILITMIATGIQGSEAPGGLSAKEWHAFNPDPITFAEAMGAVTNICFAYSFAVTQFSFMSELARPTDYPKAIWSLGIIEIVIYTLTGSIIYVFVGDGVQSPALLSAGATVSKVAFGVALPVIFISGSINTQVVGRFIHHRIFAGTKHQYINTKKGVISWLLICLVITIFAFVVAEAIPFFNDLLSIISSLFISGFTFWAPALMYFVLLRDSSNRFTLVWDVINGAIFLIGVFILVGGTYASIVSIKDKYAAGTVSSPFTCNYS